MPEVVRRNQDHHVGHTGRPGPYHKTYYKEGSPNVFVNNEPVIRQNDPLVCGDRAKGTSPNVYANNILIHRKGDATTGHGAWPPVTAETGSPNVFANS